MLNWQFVFIKHISVYVELHSQYLALTNYAIKIHINGNIIKY